MNASRLYFFVLFLLREEGKLGLQTKLTEFLSALQNLVNTPQDSNHQTEVTKKLADLEASFSSFENVLTPAQVAAIEEIGASQFFSSVLVKKIRSLMAENPMTPTVARDGVDALRASRENFIAALQNTHTSLKTLGVRPDDLKPDSAEIGFLLPRELFSNRLDLLVKELRDIELIIRQFSEVVLGTVEEITVRQISTSDPIFFFGINAYTIGAIGASITWMLNTWRQALEIKKKYNELKELGIDEDILGKIENNVKKKVEQSIKERAAELIKEYRKDDARKNELEAGLKWAMQSLMARVERGMIVEVRFLPPPKPKDGASNAEDQAKYQAQSEQFSELAKIAKGLEFPAIEGEPILQIPPPKNVDGSAVEPKSEQKKKGN
jgi:hypothetical protein